MVYRIFTEKKPGCDVEARGVLHSLREDLGLTGLDRVRILNRYDAEGLDDTTFALARDTVFSEPQVDFCYDELPQLAEPHRVLAVEALPGQFDQRADSCAQCIQILSQGERPRVAYARIYLLCGVLSDRELDRVRLHLINPVEAREASLERPETLSRTYGEPAPVGAVTGLTAMDDMELEALLTDYGLAMDLNDLQFLQTYFREEGRDPTVTELRVIDTYWSDHCRHTTFGTHLDRVEIADPEIQAAYDRYLEARHEVYGDRASARPQTLMDLATIGAKVLKKRGLLDKLDESEEINACSIRVTARVDGGEEDWLLLFKNETHNHPTEIEPFGGAATCIGGCIRDPLSGRAYVYQAMRVTGSGDPRAPIEDTVPGKLPQKKLTTTAAAGYSAYGNQIGLATGLVHEIYHPGYVAKRMEVGAVVGAVPAENVVRERPEPGDRVILVGGRTGRDGCGGATGSSKSHDASSLTECAAEVQKGNAPEERKIQRLFRKRSVARLIRRCNDFGAGGVSVAVGELADGLDIDLGSVRKKYEGLDGTEIAISESQERMAVVVRQGDVETFIAAAREENLEAYEVARVTESPRMVMRLEGRVIVDLSREFLSSNGAVRHSTARISGGADGSDGGSVAGGVSERMRALVSDLRYCSQRGLGERFDSTVGGGSVLAPYGGKFQRSPAQAMAALLPVQRGETTTASVMAFGFDPCQSACSPFHGARDAVTTSVAKLVATGCDPDDVYLTFQEYFPHLGRDPDRWGLPVAALLGALDAQLGLEIGAIGGKDSMSGSFMDLDVPPTLISFAVAPCGAERIISPEFKGEGHFVYYFPPGESHRGTKAVWRTVAEHIASGRVRAARAVTGGGVAEALFKLAVGNEVGFVAGDGVTVERLFCPAPGGIVVEADAELPSGVLLGRTSEKPELVLCGETLDLRELIECWEGVLEGVFPRRAGTGERVPPVSCPDRFDRAPAVKSACPRAVIPAFPGTNCEEDTARAIRRAGGEADIVVVKNLTADLLARSVEEVSRLIESSQMIVIPGGFSGGDEPEGSAKFIASFFRNPRITQAVHDLLRRRDGLILGICNGFQALIKLGLVPYGEIRPVTAADPTLTFNLIGRHQSSYVTTRVASVRSPWMGGMRVGETYTVPVSHGEGRLVAEADVLQRLIDGGQIATQYCDFAGRPTMDIDFNPNGSAMAIEGILSPDGRVLGKMAHTERRGPHVGKNIIGNLHQPIFESGVAYFK